jgi:hypothetical protein
VVRALLSHWRGCFRCVMSAVYMWTAMVLHEIWAKAVMQGFCRNRTVAAFLPRHLHLVAACACAAS